MYSQLTLVIKVLVISTGLSLLIKYVCVELPIAPSSTNALIGISFPAVIMALLLGWRRGKKEQV